MFRAEANDGSLTDLAQIQGVFENASSTSPNTSLRFLTRGGGALTERMAIDQNGNVGIGTTTPTSTAALHVVGNMFLEGKLTIKNPENFSGIGAVWHSDWRQASHTTYCSPCPDNKFKEVRPFYTIYKVTRASNPDPYRWDCQGIYRKDHCDVSNERCTLSLAWYICGE